MGHDVLRTNHVGDWGTQFGMLISHLNDEFPDFRENPPPIEDLQVFYQAAKARFDTDEDFKTRSRETVVKLQSGGEEETEAWKMICDISRKEFQKIYDRLDIVIEEKGESFYNPMVKPIVDKLTEEGFVTEDDGA